MASMTMTGFTCPVCDSTICADVAVVGQARHADGTVQLTLKADLTSARAHVEDHR